MIYQQLAEHLELFVRMAAAAACGCFIGYERKNRNKGAGIRTHTIVALGAALIMIVSKYGFADIPDFDASRVASQIVSGVGFLGAGIIFVRNNAVSGLTTAAGIWATSGIGMAVGAGLYDIGFVGSLLMVAVQFLLHKGFVIKKEHRYEQLELTIHTETASFQKLQEILSGRHIDVISMGIEKQQEAVYRVSLEIGIPAKISRAELMDIVLGSGDIMAVKG